MGALAARAASHYAPPLITATIADISLFTNAGARVRARTTRSVLTHLDSSTFARPL